MAGIGIAGLIGGGIIAYQFGDIDLRSLTSAMPAVSGCHIKGNISENGRIYHVPGQRYYSATRIDTREGERWFCSEAEARAAGWRRAKV